jgi:hypothetical protein
LVLARLRTFVGRDGGPRAAAAAELTRYVKQSKASLLLAARTYSFESSSDFIGPYSVCRCRIFNSPMQLPFAGEERERERDVT